MKKKLIATITYNSTKITNECFIKSLYKYNDPSYFDLWVISTSDTDFVLDEQFKYDNITILNFKKLYNVYSHAPGIQKILDLVQEH